MQCNAYSLGDEAASPVDDCDTIQRIAVSSPVPDRLNDEYEPIDALLRFSRIEFLR